jgi:hypothetical protein
MILELNPIRVATNEHLTKGTQEYDRLVNTCTRVMLNNFGSCIGSVPKMRDTDKWVWGIVTPQGHDVFLRTCQTGGMSGEVILSSGASVLFAVNNPHNR